MREIWRGNDWVALSFLEALLRDAGLRPVVLDRHMSVLEGSIGALPRRLAVPEAEAEAARGLLREAGIAPFEPGRG